MTLQEYRDQLDPSGIWSIAQNKPTLIASDLEPLGIPREITYSILLGRGVFKWLAVRRDLIGLKDSWKSRVTATIAVIRKAKQAGDWQQLMYQRGYLRAYEEARSDIRDLCHSERFRVQDNDSAAQRFLQQLGETTGIGEEDLRDNTSRYDER